MEVEGVSSVLKEQDKTKMNEIDTSEKFCNTYHEIKDNECVNDSILTDNNRDQNEHVNETKSNTEAEEHQNNTELKSTSLNTIIDESCSRNLDSVQESVIDEDVSNDKEIDNVFRNATKLKKKKHLMIMDSDSEEEIIQSSMLDQNVNQDELSESGFEISKKKHKRLVTIEDSDSDVENEVTPHNKSFSDYDTKTVEEVIYAANSKGELVAENLNSGSSTLHQKSRLSALCDSDSDENCGHNEQSMDETVETVSNKKRKSQKRSQKSQEKPKKMTARQAAKLRLEIMSEAQRMMREKIIHLPYHKPKSYTLKEFLTRRPKLSATVSYEPSTPPSVAIKMSTEQLAIISKKLEERKEELKEFYRSESESENDDNGDEDYIPPEEKSDRHMENDKDRECPVSDKEDNTIMEVNTQSPTKLEKYLEQDVPKVSSETNHTVIIEATQEPIEKINGDSEPMEKSDCDIQVVSNLQESDDCTDGNKELTKDSQEPVQINAMKNVESSDSLKITKENTIKGTGERESYSIDYEFNLDDLEENSERIVPETEVIKKITDKLKSGFEYTDLDREIENFGSSCDNNEEKNKIPPDTKLSKLDVIKEKLANIKPRLSGGFDDVIDLELGVTKPNEVTKLMERFVKHTSRIQLHKNKVKLSIVSVESGEVHTETVAMNVDDVSPVIEEKPGAKLQKLRDELQTQMAQKRSELWQKKANRSQEEDIDHFEGEKDECGAEDDILDDEEEETELTESSEEEEEDEEENEAGGIEKERVKSAFIDEEADETDEEDEDVLVNKEDDVIDEDVIDEEDEQIEDKQSEEESSQDVPEEQPTNRTLRRIVRRFSEDSDDEDFGQSLKIVNSKAQANEYLIGGNSQDDDDFIPPHQPQASQTPIRKVTQTQSKPDFEFLTPISYITGLQNLNNSASKAKDTPTSLLHPVNEPSPLKENNWQQSLQKKLFAEEEITNSQLAELCSDEFTESQASTQSDSVNEEILAGMCSGKFPSTQGTNESEVVIPSTEESQSNLVLTEEPPSTQDLLNLCSGGFTGVSESVLIEEPHEKCHKVIDTYQFGTNKEIKSLDEDQDLIISQLIDEEEMENFKRKFDSPLLTNTQRRIVEEFEEVVGSGGIIDSDDEEEVLEVKKRKNQKKLMFSDDEYSDDERQDEEVIDLHDNVDNDDDLDEEVASNADIIDYDSEENEIDVTEASTKRMKISDFVENEAELSESDWDSADEDEKDLDKMEFEQGDAEKFDEKKIRSDLERIHMRRLLDDDTREVKMLQEMLLEDGELHGSGRVRQFKWRNIDSMDDTAEEKRQEDDLFIEEEESEEQWRKKRYEREMFLKEKVGQSKAIDDNILGESQLLKIGHKVMQRSQASQSNTPTEKTNTDPDSPVVKQPFSLLNKRGSFLKRGDEVLQRLALYNKSTTVIFGGAKNSKGFLFQTTSEKTSVTVGEKKRKAKDDTPRAIKKLRLSSNLSPALNRRISNKPESARAKLFKN